MEKNTYLKEENYREVIESYTLEDWKPLLALIPEIENTKEFGRIVGGFRDENGVFQMPMWVEGIVIGKFIDVVYNMPIIISFKWYEWDEGREMGKSGFDFDSVDIPTKCKLITAIVRNDRFCDGALVSAFESGIILRILKSIERQVKAKFAESSKKKTGKAYS